MNIAVLPRFKAGTFEGVWNGNGYSAGGYLVEMAKYFRIGYTVITTEYDFEKVCSMCDGLIIPGSPINIDPTYWGGQAFDPPNVADEYALDALVMDCFARQNKPMFGICGGIQALNVFFGGTLNQVANLRDASVSEKHAETIEIQDVREQPLSYNIHNITVEKDSFVYDIFKAEKAVVNTYHGWAVEKVAPGFRVVARSDDGIVEAIESKEKRVFGTQWHPELAFRTGDDVEKRFFENFIRCCEQSR